MTHKRMLATARDLEARRGKKGARTTLTVKTTRNRALHDAPLSWGKRSSGPETKKISHQTNFRAKPTPKACVPHLHPTEIRGSPYLADTNDGVVSAVNRSVEEVVRGFLEGCQHQHRLAHL